MTHVDGEMHRKLNSVVENQVTGNIFIYSVASLKKIITLSYISLSKILSKLDNRDVCLQSEHFKFHSFLEIGITLAILISEGKTHAEKERYYS